MNEVQIRNEEQRLTIPEEYLDDVIEMSDDQALWGKLVVGGINFPSQDKVVKFLVGRLIAVTPYLINFEAGDRTPAKLPHVKDDHEIPEGYSRRCDVKLLTNDGQVIGLSLAPSSMKYQLSPYLKFLKNIGQRPENVVTEIKSKQVSNNLGTFCVAVFKKLDGPPEQQDASKNAPPREWN